jgi:hypothetical protein
MVEGTINTCKKPSAGLDLIREVVDSFRTSYKSYLPGWVQVEDAQKLVQMKRTSEAGLQTGYALFVDGKMERLPDELAQDCVFPEGIPDSFTIMNALLNAIPRDAEFDSQMWTTVDLAKNNMRSKMVSRLLKGFGLYLLLTGKNFLYEGKTEARYRDMLIVCNIVASSGPNDMEGLLYRVNGLGNRVGATDTTSSDHQNPQHAGKKNSKTMEEFEDGMDSELFRGGVVRSNTNPKCKNKVCVCACACVKLNTA